MLGDVTLLRPRLALGDEGIALPEKPRAGGFGEPEPRLVGLHYQEHAVLAERGGLDGRQMLAVQLAIPCDAGVDDPAVERGHDLHLAGPVQRPDRHFEGREMRPAHVHQAAAFDRRFTARLVADGEAAGENTVAQVELLPEVDRFVPLQIEPVAIGGAKRQRQPVGEVDQVLVLDHLAGNIGLQPVVSTGEIGAGIVDGVGARLLGGAAGGEVTVAERAQGLPQALFRRRETLVDELPVSGCRHGPKYASVW